VADAEHGVVIAATAHVHEGYVLDTRFRRSHRQAARDGIHDGLGLKRRAFGKPGQVQVQPPVLMRGHPLRLSALHYCQLVP
jgi:hypothetical protein